MHRHISHNRGSKSCDKCYDFDSSVDDSCHYFKKQTKQNARKTRFKIFKCVLICSVNHNNNIQLKKNITTILKIIIKEDLLSLLYD